MGWLRRSRPARRRPVDGQAARDPGEKKTGRPTVWSGRLGFPGSGWRWLHTETDHVLGRRALGTVHHVELHPLTLCQGLEAVSLNC